MVFMNVAGACLQPLLQTVGTGQARNKLTQWNLMESGKRVWEKTPGRGQTFGGM